MSLNKIKLKKKEKKEEKSKKKKKNIYIYLNTKSSYKKQMSIDKIPFTGIYFL